MDIEVKPGDMDPANAIPEDTGGDDKYIENNPFKHVLQLVPLDQQHKMRDNADVLNVLLDATEWVRANEPTNVFVIAFDDIGNVYMRNVIAPNQEPHMIGLLAMAKTDMTLDALAFDDNEDDDDDDE